jgi:hypothetical protein
MWKVLLTVSLATVCFATVSPAAAAPGGSESAVGAGETDTGSRFAFSAHNTPQGTIGRFVVRELGATVTGHVTCLTVAGNVATFVGEIEKSGLFDVPPGSGFVMTVTDNGHPVNGQPVDLFLYGYAPGFVPADCPPFGGTSPLTHGNVVVQE